MYLTTGGQPSSAASTDFVAAARACGFQGQSAKSREALRASLEEAQSQKGPLLVRVAVGTEAPRTGLMLEDPVVLCEDFRRWLHARRG